MTDDLSANFDQIDANLRAAEREQRFSGVVLAGTSGTIAYHAAFGVANRDFDVPVALDTRFNLASMNKMFTAVAVARLMEAGALAADATIDTWLEADWLPDEVRRTVRVVHLLNHTSGLGNYFTPAFRDASRERFRNIEEYRELVREHATLAFEPGTDWRYSNIGYMLLGQIIQCVTGDSYYEHIRRHVYAPAGMTETDVYPLDEAIPRAATGYSRVQRDGRWVWATNLFQHVIRGGPAGGGFSTAEDLHRFGVALHAGALAPRSAVEALWIPTPQSIARGKHCGGGFFITQRGRRSVVGHTGTFAGISNLFELDPAAGACTIILANCDYETYSLATAIWNAIDAVPSARTTMKGVPQ